LILAPEFVEFNAVARRFARHTVNFSQ